MLTKQERQLIKDLHKRKGREEQQRCLVEGDTAIEMAGDFVESVFTQADALDFASLVTSKTPNGSAAIARLPEFTLEDVTKHGLILALDDIQDPGNMGTLFRLAFAFDAALIIAGGADPLSPKVIRSATGTVFKVPFIHLPTVELGGTVSSLGRSIFRLEKRADSIAIQSATITEPAVLIVGNEGNGIQTQVTGQSVHIPHSEQLDSLNVAVATTIAVWEWKRSSL
jgi:TrmH family RNA methyltransferase